MWSSSTIKHQQHHRQTLSLHVHDVVRKCNCYYCFFGWKWCELFAILVCYILFRMDRTIQKMLKLAMTMIFSLNMSTKDWRMVFHSLTQFPFILRYFLKHICIQLIFKLFVCAIFFITRFISCSSHLTALCIVLSRSSIIIIRLCLKFVAHFALTLCVLFGRLLTTHDFPPSAHCSVFKMWFCMYHVFIVHSG